MEVLQKQVSIRRKPIEHRGPSEPYLGEVHVGHDDNVDGAGRILGGRAGVTTRVVLILALGRASLPRHAVLGDRDGGLGCGRGRGAACR